MVFDASEEGRNVRSEQGKNVQSERLLTATKMFLVTTSLEASLIVALKSTGQVYSFTN